MSLTAQLAKSGSVIRAFMDDVFVDHLPLSRAWRTARPAPSSAATPKYPNGVRVPHSLLGQAIEHRLRYAFIDGAEIGVSVSKGMDIASSFGKRATNGVDAVAEGVCDELDSLVHRYGPADRSRALVLPWSQEERLLRLCYLLAEFEVAYRAPQLPPLLAEAGAAHAPLAAALAAVPAACVEDLARQVRLAETGLGALRQQTSSSQVRAGAQFTGSTDVDGADADLIADGVLIDVKATSEPGRIGKAEFRQLAGYVLLDYDDECAINRVGFYLSRYGALVTWDVEEFFTLLGARHNLGDLRQMLSEDFEPQRRERKENWQRILAGLPPDIADNLRVRSEKATG